MTSLKVALLWLTSWQQLQCNAHQRLATQSSNVSTSLTFSLWSVAEDGNPKGYSLVCSGIVYYILGSCIPPYMSRQCSSHLRNGEHWYLSAWWPCKHAYMVVRSLPTICKSIFLLISWQSCFDGPSPQVVPHSSNLQPNTGFLLRYLQSSCRS